MKKLFIFAAYPLKLKILNRFFMYQLTKYNKKTTGYFGSFGARFRYKNSFFKKELFSNPVYVTFEGIKLPVPEKYDELLTQIYGDYMTPPPIKEQVGWHLKGIDFGKY